MRNVQDFFVAPVCRGGGFGGGRVRMGAVINARRDYFVCNSPCMGE